MMKGTQSLEGWDGREVGGRFQREGTHVHLMPIHVDVQQKSSQYSNYALIKHFLKIKQQQSAQ